MNSKYKLTILLVLLVFSISFAVGGDTGTGGDTGGGNPGGGSGTGFNGDGSEIQDALNGLCVIVKNALAVGMMLMVVTAALVYAIGQVMGAETRARASVWATSMFNGAIVAALIYILVPMILTTLLSNTSLSDFKTFCN